MTILIRGKIQREERGGFRSTIIDTALLHEYSPIHTVDGAISLAELYLWWPILDPANPFNAAPQTEED